jgi:hypothetical protein
MALFELDVSRAKKAFGAVARALQDLGRAP